MQTLKSIFSAVQTTAQVVENTAELANDLVNAGREYTRELVEDAKADSQEAQLVRQARLNQIKQRLAQQSSLPSQPGK